MQLNTKNKVGTVLLYCLMTLAAAVFLLPIVWVVISSFKPASELFAWPPTMFPVSPTLENYTIAFSKGEFGRFFVNSFFVTVVATVLTLLINVMSGYAFAKYEFKGRGFLFGMVLATMLIPLEVIMIPIFKVIVAFNLYNNLWGVIIPAIATPTGVFLIRQYYVSIPDAYMEAARIDGAGETKIFTAIMLPMATPVLAVLSIFSFMWRWNDFLWPKLVINSKELYTIQLALATFAGEYSVDWNSLLSMSVISMIPVLIIFLVFQKHIIGGLSAGGVKE